MGFKRISIKDLETRMIPAFLGLPLKHIEEKELLKGEQKEQKLSIIEKESNVFLLNEEILEYNYDKNGVIQNFIGTGNITIINNSKKDRIWDVKLILSGTQNTNVQSDEAIRLGNYEPKSNKVINYSIVEHEELPDPVKVTELIEVLDLNTEKIDLMQDEISVEADEEDEIITQKVPEKIKDLDLPKSENTLTIKKEKTTSVEKEPLDKEALLKKEVDDEFDSKNEKLNLKFDHEREVLEEINKQLKEYATERKKQNNTINSLKKNYNSLLKAKANALKKRLKQLPKDTYIENSEYESLLNNIKSQISEIEEDITKIEEKYSKQEATIKKDVDDEYKPQINSFEAELSIKQDDLNETTKNITDWNIKRNDLSEIIKDLKKKHKTLPITKSKVQSTKLRDNDEEDPSIKKVESQIKIIEEEIKKIEEEYLKKEATIKNEVDVEINSQIENIDSKISVEQKSLDEIFKNVSELNEKKKELTKSIKTIKRDHETLLKTKSKELSTRLKKTPLDKEFVNNVEKEVDDEYNPQIENLESELNAKQKNLDDIIKNFNEWSTKKNESSVLVKNLKIEHEKLLKTKSKELRTRIKANPDKEKTEKEIKEGILKKEVTVKNEIDNEFNSQIKNIDSKLNIIQKNLDETIENLNEWSAKKNSSSEILKNLKKEHENLLKTKSKALNKKLQEIKLKELSSIDDESEKKLEKEIDNEFDPQIKNVNSKLSVEQENLAEAIKNVNEWVAKKNELNDNLKNLNKESKNILKIKSKALNTRLKKITGIDEFSKKIEKEVDDEYNPQIKNLESELNTKQKNLDDIVKNFNEWSTKKNESSVLVKNLKNEHEKLLKIKSKELRTRLKNNLEEEKEIKEDILKKEVVVKKEIDNEFDPQIKNLESELNAKQKNLDDIVKNVNELNEKERELSNSIKVIKKEAESLLKNKSVILSTKLKELIKEKEIKIEEIKNQLSKKQDEITKFKKKPTKKIDSIESEVKDKDIPQIESELNVEKENFNEVIKKIDELTIKKKEINEIIKDLKNNQKNLLKAKSKAFSTRLEELNKEEEIELDEFRSQIRAKQENLKEIKKGSSIIDASEEKEVEIEYKPKINSAKEKLDLEQNNLEKIIEKIDDLTNKKNELITNIKDLEKTRKSLLKEKSKALRKRLKEKENIEKTPDLDKKDEDSEITRIEEVYSEKEANIKKEIEEEFNSQINSIESKLNTQQEILDETLKNANEWNIKKNELSNNLKNLKKDRESLLKALGTKLKKRDQISEKQDKITKFKNKPIKKDENLSKIASIQSELRVNQENYDDAIKYFNEWNKKRKKLNDIVKDLKNEEKKILKTKSKALNTRLKEIDEEKKIKLNEIKEEIKTKKTAEPKIEEIEEAHEEDVVSESAAIDSISSKAKEKEIKKKKEKKKSLSHEFDKLDVQNNLILLYNQKNTLKFTIKIENTTKYTMKKIRIGKVFSEDYFNFKYESKTISKVELIKNNMICTLKELKAKEKADIIIFADINPKEKKLIGTGQIQLSYNYIDYLISGMNLENFTAHSHAMHAIKIKEEEIEANLWVCSVLFKNNSDLEMELKSILVLDKKKENKFIDLDFDSNKDRHLIKPGESFKSKEWKIKDENEPKFFRKLGYSVTHRIEKNSRINIKFEENIFDIVDLGISKRFSITEIKSFEEDIIDGIINIKNISTIPIQRLRIIDLVPEDFVPPIEISDYQLRTSTGRNVFGDIKLNISPNNQDHTVPHVIEIIINSESISGILDVNEFLEVKYQFKAISPSYRKKYDYKLDINSYFLKEKINPENYYCIENSLSKNEQPELNIIHKRRDLLISKEIFPGRTVDEFVINIMINNNSNIEVNNIEIKDTISKSFELLSSNIKYVISESEGENNITLSFMVDRILPNQESEIRYYVKNKSGKKIDYDELESFIFG